MKKRLSDNKSARALAAFAAAGTAPALAQSSGTWSAGISARNIRPFVHASSTNRVDRIAPGKLASGPQDLGCDVAAEHNNPYPRGEFGQRCNAYDGNGEYEYPTARHYVPNYT